MATKWDQELVVVLFDFEKPYDHVEWSFLEGTLLHSGLSSRWVNRVLRLYESAHSIAIALQGLVPRFGLSQLVRKAFPQASLLFLFS